MFGLEELKEKTEIRGDTVVCPVTGCETQVKKMTKRILKSLDAYLEKGRCKTGNFVRYLFVPQRKRAIYSPN